MAAASATSDYPRGNGTGSGGWTGAARALLLGLIVFALLRTASLVFSPLELGVDEVPHIFLVALVCAIEEDSPLRLSARLLTRGASLGAV